MEKRLICEIEIWFDSRIGEKNVGQEKIDSTMYNNNNCTYTWLHHTKAWIKLRKVKLEKSNFSSWHTRSKTQPFECPNVIFSNWPIVIELSCKLNWKIEQLNNWICHIFNLKLWINICVFHTTVSKLNHLVQDFNNERKLSYIVTYTRMMLSRAYDVITCAWCYHVCMMLSRVHDFVTWAHNSPRHITVWSRIFFFFLNNILG